jgi:hypothetical protein
MIAPGMARLGSDEPRPTDAGAAVPARWAAVTWLRSALRATGAVAGHDFGLHFTVSSTLLPGVLYP